VSYGLAVAGDARADLRMMDIWLQEEVWDELESLAADPSPIPLVPPGNSVRLVLSRIFGGVTYEVVIAVVRNDARKTLTVLGVSVEQ
jgi:hypothetical protein